MKIDRRRYTELIAFLKDTIKDSARTHGVRMAAAARLDSLYERHELAEAQTRGRVFRLDLAALTARAGGSVTPLPDDEPEVGVACERTKHETDGDERTAAIWASLGKAYTHAG